MKYDSSKPVGQRVTVLTLNGKPVRTLWFITLPPIASWQTVAVMVLRHSPKVKRVTHPAVTMSLMLSLIISKGNTLTDEQLKGMRVEDVKP